MTTARELDERYGRTGRRPLLWIIGGILAAAVVAYFGWITVSSQMNAVDADDLGFSVVDEHRVDLTFQYTAPRGADVACAVEALDVEFGVVGWKIVEFSASDEHTSAVNVSIPTVAEATTGLVKSCWVA
ncbi:DUF4307 domain-containing protein [Microbacterium esteraromaticum]|uniref:DUF4307 domain-containing protein n=1 Tax=Microbacterium esteraromaticum TaxID=57043 RepID=A0A939DUQ2_9MICO|nr:DUF4307 domain-containing protein [Microbacterium esteraromaticum]MBN7793147.1 DUF4307 domain-containing protein [Microbacterium esteraromaticum]MBN8205570.1 DUF4307 domain-containing protein [Microbacterium esteraromaticum]MBN8415724.1 DUF4307 domain-containing protein [Microbacterium esteraromaticum]MBN8423930.1 DUF4307 domain-containing protein [Microbacterium esteraromaticum]MCA1305733.1 DUF4307 domain-containing protein [Microbacterium esteraromaticum]